MLVRANDPDIMALMRKKKSKKPVARSLPEPGLLPEHTARSYGLAVRRFNEENRGRPITPERIMNHLRGLDEKGLKPATVRLALSGIKNAVSGLTLDPADRVEFERTLSARRLPKPKSRPSASGVPEADETLRFCESLPEKAAPVVKFLFNTGLRSAEARKIRIEDCKRKGNVVYIAVRGKGNREREAIINGDLYDRITEAFGSRVWLFENKNTGKPVCQKTFYNWTEGAHRLRHACANHLLRNGVSLPDVAHKLGHHAPDVTARFYLHPDADPEGLLKHCIS